MRVTPVVVCLVVISPGSVSAGRPFASKDLVEMAVERVYPIGRSNVVLLRSRTKPRRYLPIWIGTNEALAISLRLAGRKPPRPLTHDLLERVVQRLGAKVTRIQIEGLRHHIFIGRLFLRQGGRSQSIDARPSDCIALALGAGAPIFAARGVLARAGMRPRDFLRKRSTRAGAPGESLWQAQDASGSSDLPSQGVAMGQGKSTARIASLPALPEAQSPEPKASSATGRTPTALEDLRPGHGEPWRDNHFLASRRRLCDAAADARGGL